MMSLSSLAAPVGSRFFINRDGLRLHYLEAGRGQKTIVLIPGWLMPAAVFRLQLEALGEQFRVLAFDPRSQGQSEISNEAHAPPALVISFWLAGRWACWSRWISSSVSRRAGCAA